MLFNFIMIILVVVVLTGLIVYYLKNNKDAVTENEIDNIYSVNYITQYVSETFAAILKENLKEQNLDRRKLEKKDKLKTELRAALKEAAYGNRNSKRFIKKFIRDIIQEKDINSASHKIGITRESVDKVIHFSSPKVLKPRDKFEIAVYLRGEDIKKHPDAPENEGKSENDALTAIIHEYKILDPIYHSDGTFHYEFSIEKLDEVYDDIIARFGALTYDEKLDVIAQRIFADYKGFGAADILFDQSIDEIDGGVSGVPQDSYDIKVAKNVKLEYSYESIWVMVHGINIKFSCLSFGTQSELIRICQNIYKYNAAESLSRRNGKIVGSMVDGSRIVVCRPPFCESWCFFARKFDSTPQIEPHLLLRDEDNIIPLTLMKWFIKGYRTIAITSQQGSGKSTTLKSFIKYVPEELNLRVQELAFELNLRYTYPERNIVTFQETETVTAQDGLDLQKKTNGAVNIIGEVASAEAASWVIQTSMVASLFTLFTHHAKTTRDLVVAIRNNLLECAGYSNERAAEEMVAKVLNIDMHMTKQKDRRFCERITEIIPIRDRRYPSEKVFHELSQSEKVNLDAVEYFKRETDRQLFDTKNICEWHEGRYVLVNMPSRETMTEIANNLSAKEEKLFYEDMEMLREKYLTAVTDDMRR